MAKHSVQQSGEKQIKYILYSHFAYDERDLQQYKPGMRIETLDSVRFLVDHFRGLQELLTVPGHEGMLVLFYSAGYESLVDNLGDTDFLKSPPKDLQLSNEFRQYIMGHLNEHGLQGRLRLITPWDLTEIFGRVNEDAAENLKLFFLGKKTGIRYDAPKIMESILRLRLLGNGIPVFRLDHDVLFRDNAHLGDLGLFKSVACSLRAHHLRMEDQTVSTFLFSASYNTRSLLYETGVDRYEAWSRAFATRIFPAILVDPEAINPIYKNASQNDLAEVQKRWDEYLLCHLNESVLCRYYGLKEMEGSEGKRDIVPNSTSGLTAIGAHPVYAVISGALLCLSEGAIIDLPPFSNFQNNVMWIDDHLKYSLHRAMGHFTSGETLDLKEDGLSDARLDNVMVTKARPRQDNLVKYVFGSYLPTVFYGTIMDAWITSEPILKCRASMMEGDDKAKWQEAREREDMAPLPDALKAALNEGRLGAKKEKELRDKLEKSALRRINEVRELWSDLTLDGMETFASLWAKGEVKSSGIDSSVFSEIFGGTADIWQGLVLTEGKTSVERLTDLPSAIMREVEHLIDDAVDYVTWTLEWPKITQIVRSVPRGAFTGDINWK